MVEFVVHLPEGTPHWEPVFLTGSGKTLGRWSATAVALERYGDGTARVRLHFPPGSRVQYLITRGDWRRAESDGHGHERTPRELATRQDAQQDVHVAGWGRDCIHYHKDFPSQFLPHARPVTVYLPPGYDMVTQRRYPVMYLHDGQNLFDASTSFAGVPWSCDDTAERAARNHEAEPVILVGIGNTPDRMEEYGPTEPGDMADAYGRFLVEEVKPFMDSHYRTATGPENTAIGGSSMGGLISLHLAQVYPHIFGRCAAMSPSIWWNGERLVTEIASGKPWPKSTRLWLDMGDNEYGSKRGNLINLRRSRKLVRLLRKQGLMPEGQYRYVEAAGAQHNEAAWCERFSDVLKYLFPAHSSHAG
jgi:predicted alpha/beta superfamily hydrolase